MASLKTHILPRGTIIGGGYRLGRTFAEGGFSVIYRAVRESDGLPVAVKLLSAQALARDPVARERFEREVSSLTELNHPHVVKTYDAGVTEAGDVFLVMERLFGSTLSKHIQQGPVEVELAMTLLRQMLSALEHIHERGLVHRDIKPSNILLTDPDRTGAREFVKLIDFGFVKLLADEEAPSVSNESNPWARELTSTEVLVGTPGYMAPEMLLASKVTPQADLYAVGVVTHELLTGKQAFPGQGVERARAQLAGVPDTPPAELLAHPIYTVIRGLLQPNPEKRYTSAREALDALEDVLTPGETDDASLSAAPPPPPQAPPSPPSQPPEPHEEKKRKPGLLRRLFRRGGS